MGIGFVGDYAVQLWFVPDCSSSLAPLMFDSRELGADESGKAFARAFKKIVPRRRRRTKSNLKAGA
jgi:hypothetical protein